MKKSLLEKSPFDLSGGEKRRAAIAGVLAMNPEMIILDEPTAGLDPMGRKEILDLIKSLRDETGITIVLVSHSMEDIAKLADKVSGIFVPTVILIAILLIPYGVFAEDDSSSKDAETVEEVDEFYSAIGFNLLEGYGMTETAPILSFLYSLSNVPTLHSCLILIIPWHILNISSSLIGYNAIVE